MDKQIPQEELHKKVTTLPESGERRVRLLTWLHISILLLMVCSLFFVLIVNLQNNPWRSTYVEPILGLLVLIIFAYGLNRTGHYYVSAGLTVACAVLGPWISMLMDSKILNGDFVPLTYVAISVLLSGILLPISITIILAAFQLAGLILVLLYTQATIPFNWPSFLGFIFISSAFSILSNIVSQHDLEQIDSQARQLAMSEAQLREQSIRDHLTGLFNRRYLEETLEREVQRAARKQTPLGIVMLDIDRFKNINDTLGHIAGDTLLKGLGKLLQEQVRYADIACRYGGDEFILILPEASLEVTMERTEDLRNKVRQLHVEYKDKILESLTISVGVAVFPDHGFTGKEILEATDLALYQAKREGRDCVVVAA